VCCLDKILKCKIPRKLKSSSTMKKTKNNPKFLRTHLTYTVCLQIIFNTNIIMRSAAVLIAPGATASHRKDVFDRKRPTPSICVLLLRNRCYRQRHRRCAIWPHRNNKRCLRHVLRQDIAGVQRAVCRTAARIRSRNASYRRSRNAHARVQDRRREIYDQGKGFRV